MTFTAVGSLVQTTTTTLTVNPTAKGNFYLVEVCSLGSNTIYCSSISGGNCTWVQVGSKFAGTNHTNYSTVFIGTATATGSAGATLTFSGATPTLEAAGQQFHSSVGSWAVDGLQGNLDTAASNSAMPSLTPSGPGDIYFAYNYDSGTSVGGSTSGYTFDVTAGGNGLTFNPACGSGAQAPVWGDTGVAFGVAILLKETPRTSQPLAQQGGAPAAPLPPRGRIAVQSGNITPKFTGPPFYPAGRSQGEAPAAAGSPGSCHLQFWRQGQQPHGGAGFPAVPSGGADSPAETPARPGLL